MTRDQIKDQIKEALEDLAPTASITEDSVDTPLEDLGLDSLDISGLLLAIEENFDIKIPDSDLNQLSSINDYVEYLVRSMS